MGARRSRRKGASKVSKKHPPIAKISGRLKGGSYARPEQSPEVTLKKFAIEVKEDVIPPRAFVVQCRKCGVPNSCGFQVSNIKDGNRTGAFSAEIIVLLVCRACGYAIDRCDLHVMVSGIGTWQVLKKHVG